MTSRATGVSVGPVVASGSSRLTEWRCSRLCGYGGLTSCHGSVRWIDNSNWDR